MHIHHSSVLTQKRGWRTAKPYVRHGRSAHRWASDALRRKGWASRRRRGKPAMPRCRGITCWRSAGHGPNIWTISVKPFCWRLSGVAGRRDFLPCRRVLNLPAQRYCVRCLARRVPHWKHGCGSIKLNWIEDESNQDDGYDRNFPAPARPPALGERWHFAGLR